MPLRYAIILGLAALLYAVVTPAQTLTCKSHEVCLSWTAPTHNVDSTVIATDQKPVKYRVYRKVTDGFTRLAETAGLELKLVTEPRGEQCYAVTAVDAKNAESDYSGVACTTVRFPGPTDGTIEAPSDGAIETP